jgi:mRNA interferase HicA
VKRRELLRHLAAQGCVLVREGSNHSWWGNPANGRRSAVPRHTEINRFLARKICRDLGVTEA